MKLLKNDIVELKTLDYRYLEDMFEYSSNESVAKFAGYQAHKSLDETKQMMTMFMDKNEVWAIHDRKSGKLIGSIGLHYGGIHPIHNKKVHALGFELSPSYWGKGIMVMACDLVLDHFFNDLGHQTVYANHFDFNKRSQSFISKYGMTFEGQWYNKTRQCNNSVYVMTKEMFLDKSLS